MELLFVKGEKGLVANRYGKFYFPDRKSGIKEEGLYSCVVTVEKDNYSFVSGNKVKTYIPSEEFMVDHISSTIYESNPLMRLVAFNVRRIGKSIIIFTERNGVKKLGYMKSSDAKECEIFLDFDDSRHDYHLRKLYKETRYDLVEDFVEAKHRIIYESIVDLTDENRMIILGQIFCRFIYKTFYKSKDILSIKVINNKFVKISINWYGDISSKIYAYNKNLGVMEILMDDISQISNGKINVTGSMDVKEVVNWLIENHIGIGGCNSGNIYTKSIDFKGECIDITYIDGTKDITKVTNEEKTKVEESFKAYDAFRKRVGKYVTKSNIHEFSQISLRNILELS